MGIAANQLAQLTWPRRGRIRIRCTYGKRENEQLQGLNPGGHQTGGKSRPAMNGYPPDQEAVAVETVLQQAEALDEEWA